MGFASYYEANVEIAADRAFMARAAEERFRFKPAAPVAQAAAPVVKPPLLVLTNPQPDVKRVAERSREIRELHLLCLSEMRPRAHLHR